MHGGLPHRPGYAVVPQLEPGGTRHAIALRGIPGVPQLVGIFVGAGLRFACKSRGDVVAGGQML